MARRTIVEILIQAKDATSSAFRSAMGGLARFRDQLFSLNTLFQGIIAGAIVSMGKKLVEAFGQQEKAIIQLNTALRITGRYTEDATKQIQAMSKEMQKLTTVADEQALAVSATIAQLATQLTPKQLAEVQKAAIGLSQTFGLDLQSAAILVGKALAGERDILARYGVSLDTTASQQSRFNELMAKTAGFFDVAVGSAKSLTGQMAQAANAFNDTEEILGEMLVQILGLDSATGSLRDQLISLNESLTENATSWITAGRDIVAFFVAIGKTIYNVLKVIVNGGVVVFNALHMIPLKLQSLFVQSLNSIIAAWDKFILGLPQPMQQFLGVYRLTIGQLADTAAEDMEQARDDITIAIEDIREGIDGLGDAWKGFSETVRKTPVKIQLGSPTTGGGSNRPIDPRKTAEDDAKLLANQADSLVKKLDLGLISASGFEKEIAKIGPRMVELKNSGLLTDETLIQLATSVEGVITKLKEMHELLSPDKGPGGFMKGFHSGVEESIRLIEHFSESLGALVYDQIGSFTDAMAQAFGLLVSGSEDASNAFKAAMLNAIGEVASSFGAMFAARAAAEVAAAIVAGPAAGKHLAAAAKFFLASTAMYAVAGAAHASASAATSGGSAGGGGQEGADQRTAGVQGDLRGDLTVVVEGWHPDDTKVIDTIAEIVEQAQGRRITVIRR